jgi:16S rRNA (guanine(966)-N(2))-methyltransferase RsmD
MIRIIGGTQKGKKIAVANLITRPLTDRIKTSIFDLISNFIPNSRVLDLFGGSGGFALEALSRGAKAATIVDLNLEAIEIINKNVLNTKFFNKATVLNRDAFKYAKAMKSKESYDIIFLDPPFPFTLKEKQHLLSLCMDLLNEENPDSLLVFRYPKGEIHSSNKGTEVFAKKYGISEVSFYRKHKV